MSANQPAESSPENRPPAPPSSENRSSKLATVAAQIAEENRGQDVVILDLRELTCIFDFFVIATGTSRRQLHAMADEIDHKLSDELGDKRLGIEGYHGSGWVLLDYGNVVVHLFEEEQRDFYAIEKLWGEAKPVAWQELSK